VILVRGSGPHFCAGADIQDFDRSPQQIDRLRDLFAQIDRCPKPVVMQLHGHVLGAGCELALAGHYRLATPGSQLGFPEVTLGLLPGGGGTQRLPRKAGVAQALKMILGGKPVDAEEARHIGLVDAIVEGEAALAWARARSRDRPSNDTGNARADTAAIEFWRAEISRRPSLSTARADIVDCVEAAVTLELAQGLALERERFTTLLHSTASRGLRHAFFSERKVARVPGLPPKVVAQKITSIGVIGAGTMGLGIALTLLNADLPVILIDAKAETLSAAVKRISSLLERDVDKGRSSADTAARRLALLQPSASLDAVGKADLVIEAVFEDLNVKREVFGQLARIAKPTAILASNTSTLDVDAIAAFTDRPGQVVGLHFFSPAHIMRLVEIVRGAKTTPEVLAASMAFVRDIGKIGVVSGNCDGFIGNRIFEEYLRQAYLLLEEGALPHQVDGVLERWGMAMGPLRTMDLAGQDIGWSIRKRRALTQPDRPYSEIPDRLCELGRFGQKTGAGYYRYPDGRTAERDPQIDALVTEHSAALGIERRTVSDEEIVERCVLAMVNEGARILAERIAFRPLDIDVIYLNGYGYPRERGGPMFYADTLGLRHVLERIRFFSRGREGWAWQPAPVIEELVARNAGFATLNADSA
jgi:3-hydroxyacyl-CoA dehydrogenase